MMHRNRQTDRKPENGYRNNWLLTFNDLMTLIFTFFVMLLAFSTWQPDYFADAANSLQVALTGSANNGGNAWRVFKPFVTPGNDPAIKAEQEKIDRNSEAAIRRVKTRLTSTPGNTEMMIAGEGPKGFTMQIPVTTIFDSAGNNIGTDGINYLDMIYKALKHEEVFLRIEVCDDASAAGVNSKASWEESAYRAAAIADYFACREGMEPGRIAAAGCGKRIGSVSGRATKAGANELPVNISILSRRI